MQSAVNDTLIETKMLNAEFLKEILNQKDDYGEEILLKTISKIRYAERLTRILKINFNNCFYFFIIYFNIIIFHISF